MPLDFDKQEYWHRRFTTESAFEWLTPSAVFLSTIAPHVLDTLPPATTKILHLGFGTSDLQNHLRARGFHDVLNLDYEPLAIKHARQRETAAFGDVRMRYAVADVTRLEQELAGAGHGPFDLVLDKSTTDAVACGGDEALLGMARGVRRWLAPGGCWVSMSYSATRFTGLEGLPFGQVEVVEKMPLPKERATDPDIFHYCYLLRPGSGEAES